jgi:fructokinase
MILAIGEILFDHFPGYSRVGGAPLNFSWHLKKLGFPVRLLSRVGDDPEGRELQSLLKEGGFREEDLQVDPTRPTGTVNVSVDAEGVPAFEILPDAAFDHLEMDGSIRSALGHEPDLIYYGTLAQRTSKGCRFMEEVFSHAGESCRFLCDLNLRPDCWSANVVEASLARADVLKLNEEELAAIINLPGGNVSEKDPYRSLVDSYGIEMLAVTRGDRGSEIHSRNGSSSTGPVKGLAVADTVGAGDAYASILAAGYLKGWEPEKTLNVASLLSSAICRMEGALPHTDLFYDEFLEMMKGGNYEK